MSAIDKTPRRKKKKAPVRKPPPRWRKYLVQAELELPAPALEAEADAGDAQDESVERDDEDDEEAHRLPWWRSTPAALGLAALCLLLLVITGLALRNAAHERVAAGKAEARARTLTLRAFNSERALRITPNPRSWSARADATIAWPDPPQLLELYLPVGYTSYPAFALVVDKVDQGRVMVVERMAPDSNRDLRLSLNSSAFGPGEYRIRVQGYSWRGERVDVGWVRLVVREAESG